MDATNIILGDCRAHFPLRGRTACARELGRTIHVVQYRAEQLGLRFEPRRKGKS